MRSERPGRRRGTPVLLLLAATLPQTALADDAVRLAPVDVIAPAPLSQPGIDRRRVPADAEVLDSAALRARGPADLLGGLDRSIAAIGFDQAQANPFQPNLVFRGYEASPLAGDAQGLAVYVDGIRFNQTFGDTVNWGLIPDIAIDRVAVEGSNPVFGMNALGGALAISLRNGFTRQGGEAELSGGSFGRVRGSLAYGLQAEDGAAYIAVSRIHDDGWRDHSPSDLLQAYGDLGWRRGADELHLGLMAADTDLTGNGASPVELLAVDRSAVFTYPDRTENHFAQARLSWTHAIGADARLDTVLHLVRFRQRTLNGDAADGGPCDGGPGLVCGDDGEPLTGLSGAPIADFLNGGTYAQLNRTSTRTTGWGGAVQLTASGRGLGLEHAVAAGVEAQAADTGFAATSELGALGADRGFVGPGVIIDQVGGPIEPVSAGVSSLMVGVYAKDAIDLTPRLTLTLSGRWNGARVTLDDRLGQALDGRHSYQRINPAAGLAWRPGGGLVIYGGYAEANRAPTPAELSCADPDAPCSLTNFFVGDPDLKQVVARTWEAGLRGERRFTGGELRWKLAGFRAENSNDIQMVASEILGRAFFRNVGRTRRQGLNAEVALAGRNLDLSLGYAFTDAVYLSPLTLSSPLNPGADGDGLIQVEPGDRLPGVARHRLKFTADWRMSPRLRLSADLLASSGQPLFGDEANLTPDTGGYVTVSVGGRFSLTPTCEVFLDVENLFGSRYATYGTFSPTADVPITKAPRATDPRSLSPGAPRTWLAGVRLAF
jgi:outer membrane receptor protein involved in Fe transport